MGVFVPRLMEQRGAQPGAGGAGTWDPQAPPQPRFQHLARSSASPGHGWRGGPAAVTVATGLALVSAGVCSAGCV